MSRPTHRTTFNSCLPFSTRSPLYSFIMAERCRHLLLRASINTANSNDAKIPRFHYSVSCRPKYCGRKARSWRENLRKITFKGVRNRWNWWRKVYNSNTFTISWNSYVKEITESNRAILWMNFQARRCLRLKNVRFCSYISHATRKSK